MWRQFFPRWTYFSDRGEAFRKDLMTDRLQAFSPQMGRWADLDYLQGTNLDACTWVGFITRPPREP